MKNGQHALAAALDRRLRRYRQALRRCQRNFSERSIHAFRIQARRLAAELELLGVFASPVALAKAQRTVKRHLDTLDSLRDAQVQLSILRRECGEVPGAKAVRKLIEQRERRCRREAEHRIRRIKPRRLEQAVELLVKRPRMRRDRDHLLQGVDAAFANVVKCRQEMNAADVSTIHRTRVAFKKFRYMVESLRLILPEITLRHLAAMRAFQGMLGDLQDTDVFLRRVDKLVRKHWLEANRVATFRNWLLRRHTRQMNRCLRRADTIFKFWPLKRRRKQNISLLNLTVTSAGPNAEDRPPSGSTATEDG